MKRGYKQTEMGVIPEEWDVNPLKGKIGISHGFAFASQHFASHGPHRLTTPGHFYEAGGFRDIGEKQKYYVGPVPNDYVLQPGDVIVAMTEQADGLLGSAAVIPQEHGYLHNQRLGRVKILSLDVELDYLVYVFNSSSYRSKVRETAAGTKVKHTSPEKLLEIPVRLPPSAEQRAIAEALIDVDGLGGGLDRLIAKKRDLKQAAMQQLLTGQTRLPGFGKANPKYRKSEIGPLPEEWAVVEVRKVTRNHKQGYYTKDRYVDSGVKLARITDLMNPQIDYPAMPMLNLPENDHQLYKIRIGDFLFARSGAIGRYGIVYDDVDAVFGSYIIRFSFDPEQVSNEYFGFLYETQIVWKQLLSITQGSSNMNINAGNIKSLTIPLPSLPEQTAIAEVLTDMDVELAALEQRWEKTRALKQAMMQELLTGRSRLI